MYFKAFCGKAFWGLLKHFEARNAPDFFEKHFWGFFPLPAGRALDAGNFKEKGSYKAFEGLVRALGPQGP